MNAAATMPGPASRRAELDELTLAGARRGEPAACRRFVAMYQVRVFAVLSRVLGPHGRQALVEDLAQDTFLRALRALPRFTDGGPAKLSSWLLTIATRRALTELGRKRPDVVDLHGVPVRAVDGDPERMHARQALERAIAELTPEQRAVFVLRDAHGLTEAEVAEALGLEVAAIKSRLHRARARLRKLLTKEGDAG